jgi:hypothetical protein
MAHLLNFSGKRSGGIQFENLKYQNKKVFHLKSILP